MKAVRGLTTRDAESSFAPLGDQAYSSVRSGILSGDLTADAPLREADLVRRLGISRTPVREALRRLQAEGLLVPVPNGGYVVVEWDPAELKNVYSVRIALERLAVRSAAENRARVDLARLAEAIDEIREATEHGKDVLPTLNWRFHVLVAEASGNPYLRQVLGNIVDIFDRYPSAELTLAGRFGALTEHQQILDAIEKQDAELAERLVVQHLERGKESLLHEGPR